MTKGEKIYRNIERLAYAKGMNVNELCKKAGVSRGTIGDYAHGRRNELGGVTLAKLTAVLECTADELLSEDTWQEPVPGRPPIKRMDFFIEKVTQDLKDRQSLRRLVRAAMRANDIQVNATAALLESIVDSKLEGGIITDNEED